MFAHLLKTASPSSLTLRPHVVKSLNAANVNVSKTEITDLSLAEWRVVVTTATTPYVPQQRQGQSLTFTVAI